MDFYTRLAIEKTKRKLSNRYLGSIIGMEGEAFRMAVNRKSLIELQIKEIEKFFDNENITNEKLEINYDGSGVPIYDVGFTAGFVELFKDGNPALLGYLNTTEVKGSDMIVRVNGDSMQGVMDDGDWIGIKRISDLEVISYGNPYGIVTQDLQLLKYLYKSNIADNLLLKSENIRHPEFDLPIKKILELYIIKVVLPYSKIKTFI